MRFNVSFSRNWSIFGKNEEKIARLWAAAASRWLHTEGHSTSLELQMSQIFQIEVEMA
jgi:hypothetical protein